MRECNVSKFCLCGIRYLQRQPALYKSRQGFRSETSCVGVSRTAFRQNSKQRGRDNTQDKVPIPAPTRIHNWPPSHSTTVIQSSFSSLVSDGHLYRSQETIHRAMALGHLDAAVTKSLSWSVPSKSSASTVISVTKRLWRPTIRRSAFFLSIPSRIRSCTAESGLPEEKSLSNPRISFCNPRISGRFFRGPMTRGPEEAGRPNDACNRTSRGRAVGGIYMY